MPGTYPCPNDCGTVVTWKMNPEGTKEWPYEGTNGNGPRHVCRVWLEAQGNDQSAIATQLKPMIQSAIVQHQPSDFSDRLAEELARLGRQLSRLENTIEALADEMRRFRR